MLEIRAQTDSTTDEHSQGCARVYLIWQHAGCSACFASSLPEQYLAVADRCHLHCLPPRCCCLLLCHQPLALIPLRHCCLHPPSFPAWNASCQRQPAKKEKGNIRFKTLLLVCKQTRKCFQLTCTMCYTRPMAVREMFAAAAASVTLQPA